MARRESTGSSYNRGMSRLALLSVSDKTGLVEFARGLVELGFSLVSTGGTHKSLKEAGLPVRAVEEVTGFPEMMDGRVKTLHPKVHGGILYLRGNAAHEKAAAAHGISPVDLVCVNLYPFVRTVRSGAPFDEAVEQIDIGGPALVRAAAKNHRHVLVVTNPGRYGEVSGLLKRGDVTDAYRLTLAAEAIRHTASYDAAIAEYLTARAAGGGEGGGKGGADLFPRQFPAAWEKVAELRYGENPHQRGALYRDPLAPEGTLAAATVLADGKGLSYCNWIDLDAAWNGALALAAPGKAACVVIKHAIPSGAAVAGSPADAFLRAWETDPVSAYGSVVGFSAPLDRDAIARLLEPNRYVEAVIAPGYDQGSLGTLVEKRKNLRILRSPVPDRAAALAVRVISGGALLQNPDRVAWNPERFSVPTKAKVPDALWSELEFAWRLVALVRSNAIALSKDRAAVGIGSGQVNRVDSVRIAALRAGERARGAVLASDAFFPFPDGVEAAIRAGVIAIVQPGGSMRDAECVAAADAAGIPMVMTGERHFTH